MRKYLIACLALFSLGLSALANAEDFRLTIHNKTGYDIHYIYLSPPDSEDWEEDVLGSSILRDGHSQPIDISGYDNPIFDIRVVDEDHDDYVFWKHNVRRHDSLTVTLDDLN
ncbi:hypothetical protein [Isoalcanivorax beigongshangi]|uniref:Argininosuccinate lyase n=1 Tax=Isoalcanivorax beigongshangi TaxID=3238810 RepID=A0ABV4AFY3_9GAMM